MKPEYVRQRGRDCIVMLNGIRRVIQDCNANKLGNTLYNRLGPKYTNSEMNGFGFIDAQYRAKRYRCV
jgi:hypothetical protein